MATFGDTGHGGVIRPALSVEETQARRAILDIARERGFACSVDPIGNLFIQRPGTKNDNAPLRIGSHLDSQIPGGNYDGVYGVLAALEVLETLDDQSVSSIRPVEVVIWNNEEGARFAPTTMGSAVHAGALSLTDALNTQDGKGLRLGDELARSLTDLGSLAQIPLGSESFGYIEAHIEQGPMLESADTPIGVVTGIQGIIQFNVTVNGEEAHAGTTPRSRRKDALVAALALIDEIRTLTNDIEDEIRFTVGRLTVAPGAPNTVPSKVGFTIDLRHPDGDKLRSLHARISELCSTFVSPCEITAVTTLNSPPIAFNRSVMAAIEKHAHQSGIKHMQIASGATHDAKFMAGLCPTGMIFIPCRDGISHNEREWAEFEHMACGANLLLRVVEQFCMSD